jgi:3-oxoacyl-[acyl-carrier-protein] synthase II
MRKGKIVELKRVVVTGMGAVTPLGNRVPDLWESLAAGTSAAVPITRFDTTNFKTKFACEVQGFDPLNHFDQKQARKLDLYSQFSLVAAEEAYRDAGLQTSLFDRTRAGVIWSSGMGGLSTLDEQLFEYAGRRGNPRFNPFFIPKIISNMASGLISIAYGLQGLNFFDCFRLRLVQQCPGGRPDLHQAGAGGYCHSRGSRGRYHRIRHRRVRCHEGPL